MKTDFHDHRAELEIIGGLLIDSEATVYICDFLTEPDFYGPENGRAFKTLIDSYQAGERISISELATRAKIRPDILTEAMADAIPATIRSSAKRVKAMAQKRHAARSLLELSGQIDNLTPEEISARASEIGARIAIEGNAKKVLDVTEIGRRVVSLQEARVSDPETIRGIQTGFSKLDGQIRGLRPRRMTVIAAATGFGKSTLALNLFAHAVQAGHRTLFMSNENDADDNIDRLCGIASGLDLRHVESGKEYQRVYDQFVSTFWGKSMFISDNSPRNIDEVTATIAKYAVQEQIEIAFIDYIGEISGDAVMKETEEMKLARYAQNLVDCARRLGIHIVVMAQLNRQGNQKGRPTKAELAGCFRIVQKAHTLLLFWQDDNKNDIVTVDKNRQGPTGADIAVDFNRRNQRITERGLWSSERKAVIS